MLLEREKSPPAYAGGSLEESPDYVEVLPLDVRVSTLPVGALGTRPHHTDYEMPAAGVFQPGITFYTGAQMNW